jgi:hypothetical protein
MEMAIRVATATNAQSKELSEVHLTIKIASVKAAEWRERRLQLQEVAITLIVKEQRASGMWWSRNGWMWATCRRHLTGQVICGTPSLKLDARLEVTTQQLDHSKPHSSNYMVVLPRITRVPKQVLDYFGAVAKYRQDP